MNPNWPRWIVASVSVYMQTVATALSLPLIVEGVDERQEDNLRQMNHAELRITGPLTSEVSKGCFRLWVDVNVLLATLMGENKQNSHDLFQHTGKFAEAMMQPIPLLKHGLDALIDDGTQFGCLTLRRPQVVGVHHFGQLGPTERLRQSAVDGRYEVYLTT